ncbi:MAG: hypothetical protein IAF02_18945 [Anaerolineae bacterium]|nr:hypothetical protein [Anaerolineae bacterium]
MKTNGSSDLPRASVSQRLASLSRFRTSAILLVVLLVVLVGPGVAISSTIPTISINSVVTDQTVSITTYNYPANQDFVVTMGPMGSMGINGYYVTTINSGAGGSFPATFAIPSQLKGSYQIAIRLESPQGYYSYNWFYNNTAGQGGQPPYTGIPTFRIVSVNTDQDVTVETNNFPANQTFTWTMGPMGTQGINGIVVNPAWNSGSGGTMTATFAIPQQLKGSYQISIRAQTGHANPFYAYNWFYNNTTGTGGQPPPPAIPGYTGYPTFTVCSVVQNGSATIRTNNLPPNQVFTVTMGPMWTAGVNGTPVAGFEAWNSGAGGTQDLTLPIPSQLYNSYQISVRMQTGHTYPFYAYNWFYNNNASGFCG